MSVFNNFILPALVILSLDAIYIFLFKGMFARQILKVQKSPLELNYISAIACYILLIFGFWYFILSEKKSECDAFILGVVIYGVYETTTAALLKNWNLKTVLIDTAWGGTLLASTAFIVYCITGEHKRNNNKAHDLFKLFY
jgi:uncharacterized membrane protein